MSLVADILATYESRGGSAYYGERVSMTEHGLQAAHFAQVEGAPERLVLAALLHDIGHLLEIQPDAIEEWTLDARHEESGARWLSKHFDAAVYDPVPYFWSDQHGLKIQFVGRAEPDDEVSVIDGDPDEERFVAAYGRRGRLVAALGMRRPARVMALQQQIAGGAAFPPE